MLRCHLLRLTGTLLISGRIARHELFPGFASDVDVGTGERRALSWTETRLASLLFHYAIFTLTKNINNTALKYYTDVNNVLLHAEVRH